MLGIKAYPNLAAVPAQVDLAIVITPAPTVPDVIAECAAAGVSGAIIISAGFKETGAAGVELEQRVLEQARRGKMRLIGPNCLGVMRPHSGLNATFASAMARPGNVAFISQSGALCTAILDWSLRANVGFSAFVSVGSMLDVGWGDLIDYLGDDPHTKSIVIYMESIGDARAFLSAAREVALTKPIIVIKAGRTEAAAQAAASHTGSLAGSDEVLDAAFRRCGVLRVGSIAELFNMAEVLAKQPRPRGPAPDDPDQRRRPRRAGHRRADHQRRRAGAAAARDAGGARQALPPHWSHDNPIDILGDAGPERYAKPLEIAMQDPDSDGLLVILTPQAMTDPTADRRAAPGARQGRGKPVLASWMGGADVAAGEAILNRANIPTFPYPDTAARAFHSHVALQLQPARPVRDADPARGVRPDLGPARRGRAAHAPGPRRRPDAADRGRVEAAARRLRHPDASRRSVAASEDEAARIAHAIGYPVVLKLLSETITHKTDVGGVQLNLADADAVRRAYRAIQAAVTKRAGAEHFQGVTVQPMELTPCIQTATS